MDISSTLTGSGLLNSSLGTLLGSGASNTPASGTGTASSALESALLRVDQRLATQQSASTAQLSAFGLLKSALDSVQTAGQALVKLPAGAPSDTLTQSMAGFFNQYNSAVEAAHQAAGMTASASAARSAGQVGRDLPAALRASAHTLDALHTLGLRLQSDGTLAQNATTFAHAVRQDPQAAQAAMATLGAAIQSAAGRELANGGPVANGQAQLGQYNSTMAAQRKAMAALETQLFGATLSSSAAAGTAGTASGVTGTALGTAAGAASGSAAKVAALASGSGGLSASEISALVQPSGSAGGTTGTLLDYGLNAYQAASNLP